MCQIIWTAEPLPIESLNVMRQHFQTVDLADVIEILTFLGPLLSGTTDWITPVSPLHSSFYEFLQDSGRSGPFYVAEDKVHLNLAISSLQVMQHGLRFNICGLQSSYLKNTEVEDLEQRVKLCIPPHLSYSCRFFAHHIQKATLTPALGVEIQFFLRSQYVLFWLEALSLLKALDIASTALDIITNCMEGYEDVYAIAKDCIKLVQTFEYAISTSTPHLYLSALPFLLAESVLSKHLFCNFSNLPLLLGGEGDLWPEIWGPFKGHVGTVHSVVFSPDGMLVVSGSEDNTIHIWDAKDGAQKGNPLKGHAAAVYSVAFSPDGRWIASGSQDHTIRLWDSYTGLHVGSPFRGHTSAVHSVSFSPDGTKIASGSWDQTICLWDTKTCSQIGNPFHDTTPGQWSICFSSSAASALVNTNGLTIRIDSEEVHNQKDLIAVSLDGWIIGPEGQLLIWVPKSVYDRLYYPWNSLVIPKSHLELDLSQMLHGDTWQLCYVEKV
ncbi:hypothetical protein ID866_5979 [Astraeus odoratus]|nr:hypothetical protein ID866_5979 [Astraeus odoratus]